MNLTELGQQQFDGNDVPDYSILAQESGYYALDWQKSSVTQKRYQYLLDNLDNYYQEVDQLKQGNTSLAYSKPYSLKVLQEMCKEIDNKGIQPILLIPPILQVEEPTTINLFKQGNTPVLFAFNNPETFPNLYQVDRRFDFVHLNDKGAKEFTRFIAEQFGQYLDTQQSAIYGQLLFRYLPR